MAGFCGYQPFSPIYIKDKSVSMTSLRKATDCVMFM